MNATTETKAPVQQAARTLYEALAYESVFFERAVLDAQKKFIELAGALPLDADGNVTPEFSAAARLDDRVKAMLAAITRAREAALALTRI